MNRCHRHDLSRYVDAELSLPKRREVNVHLRECQRCAREVENLRSLDKMLAAWGERARPVPSETESRIFRSIEQRRLPRKSRGLSALMPAALGSVLAAIVVAASINVNVLSQPNTSAVGSPLVVAARHRSHQLHLMRSQSAILGVQVETQTVSISPRRLALLSVE